MSEYNEKPKTLIEAMKKSMAKSGKMEAVLRVADRIMPDEAKRIRALSSVKEQPE